MKKGSIKLRKRVLKTGLTSLYLDIYSGGKREYEYLNLYLLPEKNRSDKEKNRETIRLAEAICAKRIVEYQNGKYGFQNDDGANVRFFDYFDMLKKERSPETNVNRYSNWFGCYQHLLMYERNTKITFGDIDQKWARGFHEYLEHANSIRSSKAPLSPNSKVAYWSKFIACMNQAIKDGIIHENPARGIENFRGEESTRMYLTLEELKTLVKTDCQNELVKRAFLFSSLTGLRFSDISLLRWKQVKEENGYIRIIFTQKKTKGQEYLDITQQAAELIGERIEGAEYVFDGLKGHTTAYVSKVIRRWVEKAGIDKKITFHCARHTFAVMMIELNVNIYTVMKLLGHRNIKNTQIYAKLLDKSKQEAIDKIPDIL